jgi:hypothetical protein
MSIGSLPLDVRLALVPFDLVVMGVLCWSFVPIIQMIVGALLIRASPNRSLPTSRPLELLFIGHLPWSLWTLGVTGVFTFTTIPVGLSVLVASLLIPGIRTAVIVSAFCRATLGWTPRRARLLTAGHQLAIWAIFFTDVFLVSGIWARFLALIGR